VGNHFIPGVAQPLAFTFALSRDIERCVTERLP
jgi:hypothetical protein